jgi:aminoglycoside phosphotransferase (APT) family kinase protein
MRSANRGFWSSAERAIELVRDAGCALRRLHDRASHPVVDASRSVTDFKRRAVGFSRLFSLSTVEQSALADTLKRLEKASLKAKREVLLQGDFWHGNLIRRPRSGELVFVDWQFAHWSADVSTDVYFFLLAAAFTGAPYGTGPERARGAAARLLEWRSTLIPAYLEAYGQPNEFVLLPLREGMLAACIEKAVRPAMDFGYSHPDDLMWRLLFSELASWPAENWGKVV